MKENGIGIDNSEAQLFIDPYDTTGDGMLTFMEF
jgi:Ca2+-binding EF-hand superfamily protein